MRGVGPDTGTRVAVRWRSRVLIAGLILAGVVIDGARADAASVSVTWDAPTTNVDGTPLTDLAGYRIYLAPATPTCPGTSFVSASSPTSTPSAGQAVSSRIIGLTAGATYFARVSAVDTTGNESACSSAAGGIAQMDLSVTPSTTTSFGSTTIGSTVDRTLTVQNTSPMSISGTASVGAPYSIVAGGAFSLAAGASQAVTVRFQPTAAGTFAGNVNFSANGDTLSRGVTGSTTSALPATVSVTRNGTGTGTVTSSTTGISCGTDCSEVWTVGAQTTLTATPAAGSTFVGWSGGCTGTGACVKTLTGNLAVTATFDTSRVDQPVQPAPVPVVSSLSPASAVAGSAGLTLTVNGNGFVPSSVVQWNGTARTTTVTTATQLSIALTGADLATARSVPVSVFTPTPGGGTSATRTLDITASPAPAPAPGTPPAAPGPPRVRQLGADATGMKFDVAWTAGSDVPSYRYKAAFVDGSAAQQGTVAGLLSLQLHMPYHTGGAAFGGFVCIRSVSATGLQSTAQSCAGLSVPARPTSLTTSPVPVASSLSPARAVAGSTTSTLTVNGSGFVAASVARWNGTARTTTVVSATQLRIALTAADLATARSVPVTVFTPAPGGGTSGAVSFAVTEQASAPAPAPSTPPAAPGSPSVTFLGGDAGYVTFAIAWGAGAGATSYRYVAALIDGSAVQQGTVTGSSFQLRMPYRSGREALSGFVCIRSVSAAGLQSAAQSCSAVPVPAFWGG